MSMDNAMNETTRHDLTPFSGVSGLGSYLLINQLPLNDHSQVSGTFGKQRRILA